MPLLAQRRLQRPSPEHLVILPRLLPDLLPSLHLRLHEHEATLHRGQRLLWTCPRLHLRIDLMPPRRAVLWRLHPAPDFLLITPLHPTDLTLLRTLLPLLQHPR